MNLVSEGLIWITRSLVYLIEMSVNARIKLDI